MDFKYFEKADKFVKLKNEKESCELCNTEKICFNAKKFKGSDEFSLICPECLQGGALTDFDINTCEGDFMNLKEQLTILNPSLSDSEIDKIAKRKTVELETTTPYLLTWQDWFWPCVDGDYCKFIGFGSKPFYKKLAGGANVEDFFKNSFYEKNSYFKHLWAESVPNSEINDLAESNKYGILFYVFKSLNSNEIVTIWDSN